MSNESSDAEVKAYYCEHLSGEQHISFTGRSREVESATLRAVELPGLHVTRCPESVPLVAQRLTPEVGPTKYVTWYDHDCPWITKYCDEHHTVSAQVPFSVLREYQS